MGVKLTVRQGLQCTVECPLTRCSGSDNVKAPRLIRLESFLLHLPAGLGVDWLIYRLMWFETDRIRTFETPRPQDPKTPPTYVAASCRAFVASDANELGTAAPRMLKINFAIFGIPRSTQRTQRTYRLRSATCGRQGQIDCN